MLKGVDINASGIIHKACFELMLKGVDINASKIIHTACFELLSKGAKYQCLGNHSYYSILCCTYVKGC